MWDWGEIRTVSASLAHTTAAAFGSSEPTAVDRHGAPFAGLDGRAVGWAVVWKRTAVEHGNKVIYKALTHALQNQSEARSFRHVNNLDKLTNMCSCARFYNIRTFMHSQLFGGIEGVGSLRTKITFRTNLRLSSLRSTV